MALMSTKMLGATATVRGFACVLGWGVRGRGGGLGARWCMHDAGLQTCHVQHTAPYLPHLLGPSAGVYGALGNNLTVSNYTALQRVVGGYKWKQLQTGGLNTGNYFT